MSWWITRFISRVGQNHVYTRCIYGVYFWQEFHQVYGHIQNHVYTLYIRYFWQEVHQVYMVIYSAYIYGIFGTRFTKYIRSYTEPRIYTVYQGWVIRRRRIIRRIVFITYLTVFFKLLRKKRFWALNEFCSHKPPRAPHKHSQAL